MDDLIEAVLEESGYRTNPYFEALRSGAMSREDFVETQVQFYFAVDFFSRPMAAVAAKIPEAHRRIEVLRNVWEEHGEGDATMSHSITFLTFLERVGGLSLEDVQDRVLWPEVRVFNTTLVGAAVLDDYLVSVAMMGIIERMFVDMSKWIAEGVDARGFLPPARMIHYNLHEAIDVRHSEDFFSVLRGPWAADAGEARYLVAQGLRLGASVFDGLYRGLHAGGSRRWRLGG